MQTSYLKEMAVIKMNEYEKRENLMEKKCETCVFCTQRPENLSFIPNEWICGNSASKWFNYWPPTGVCEKHSEPTGKTVAEILGDHGKQAIEGMSMLLNAMWGNNSCNKCVEKFLQEDSAIIGNSDDFTECKE